MELATLFQEHINIRQRAAESALQATGYDGLVISSGCVYTHFSDDQDAPFRRTPHFSHWTPMSGAHHLLVVKPGNKPKLTRYAPDDYWYEQTPLGNPFWADAFEIQEVTTIDAGWEALKLTGRIAYIGNEIGMAEKAGFEINPADITARLDWDRAYKNAYEIKCIEEASALGIKAHEAGRVAFLNGASELEIHHAYVQSIGCLDHEVAFSSIVAMNEKGATLHYENKQTLRNGKTLVLDCGANVRGYASDITRTFVSPTCDYRFKYLLAGMEKLERELASAVRKGLPFGELHHTAHLKIGTLLCQAGILRADPEEAVKKGLTKPFFPHGLGHHLGIQIHDVGGKLASPDGTPQPPPEAHPALRNTRTLEVGHLVTIEPGLYFIPMLLKPHREGADSSLFEWKLIDELMPLGGIRIEDNVLLTDQGPRNITREIAVELGIG
ncbi:MAG: Xaa-Pro dipeptidase [Holophagaceae bacterium]|nr:Xaa-Pro dipeptidase [Holophagaceae bacterium]